jgi:hypothetical protein
MEAIAWGSSIKYGFQFRDPHFILLFADINFVIFAKVSAIADCIFLISQVNDRIKNFPYPIAKMIAH